MYFSILLSNNACTLPCAGLKTNLLSVCFPLSQRWHTSSHCLQTHKWHRLDTLGWQTA